MNLKQNLLWWHSCYPTLNTKNNVTIVIFPIRTSTALDNVFIDDYRKNHITIKSVINWLTHRDTQLLNTGNIVSICSDHNYFQQTSPVNNDNNNKFIAYLSTKNLESVFPWKQHPLTSNMKNGGPHKPVWTPWRREQSLALLGNLTSSTEHLSGWGVTLPPHPLLVPWSWKCRAIPLLHLQAVRPVQNLSACTRVHFTFTLLSI
jgi:hypothetical protein